MLARLLILTIALIVYGSLYPWHLRAIPPGHNPFEAILHSIPTEGFALILRDIAVNIMVYLPVGLFAFLTFDSIPKSLLLGFGLSTCMELAQVFIEGRVSSAVDITSNTIGTAVGIAAGIVWTHMEHRPTKRVGAILMIGCWIAYQTFPFLPRLHRPKLVMSAPMEDAVLFVAEALALMVLVENRGFYLAMLLLLVPLKALIYTRFATLQEIICTLVLLAVAPFVRVGAPVGAAALAIALLFRGLSPFHFQSTPSAFGWIPFQASFTSEWEPALSIMLGKIFPYATLLLLIEKSGVRLLTATLATAVFLAAIEVTQRYLPGRSAEIIDPLIALIMGWVFWSLEQNQRRKA